ncbi:MAG TPA: acetylglutamate kinase [Bacteroidota bacterium]|nr:acetylglutamate kinase [Bacteroidota bacterium]
MIDSSTKEEVLIEALPYIQKYEGTTFVIKYGGAAMTNEQLKQTFAKDVTLLRKIGINIVIVHGGGREITDVGNALGISTKFVNGQRYTDKQMIEVVLMVLAGKVNKEIVNLINTNGGNAVGLSGMDNNLLRARKLSDNGMDLGLVGEITAVNIQFLNLLLQNGMMPVIAPVGVGEKGEIFNINADIAASAMAMALKAEKLVYLSDIEGVLVNNKLISTLTKREAESLIHQGAIFGGMIPKVNSAFKTLDAGVNKVHIIDGRLKHSLLLEIFTDEGIGTQMIHESGSKPDNRSQPENERLSVSSTLTFKGLSS